MKKLDLSRTYVDFLLDKGEGYNLGTIFDGEKNSKLLKEISTSMVENDVSIKEMLDLFDKHNVSLPNSNLLNQSHEEKIFHLGLSLYSSLLMQGTLEELAQKENYLGGLLKDAKKTNSLDEADNLMAEIEENKNRMQALNIIGVERFASLLHNPKYIESFFTEDTRGMIIALAKSDKEKEAAKKIIDNVPEQKGSMENFISEIRALIERVDIFIDRCQTFIDGHDVSAKIENEALNDSLSKIENTKMQGQDNSNEIFENAGKKEENQLEVEDKTSEKIHVNGRDYVAVGKFLKSDTEGIDVFMQMMPDAILLVTKDDYVYYKNNSNNGEGLEDILQASTQIKQRREEVSRALSIKLSHLQAPAIVYDQYVPTKEMYNKIAQQGDGSVYNEDLFRGQTIFGVHDNMQPIEELISEIKKSDIFLSYIENPEMSHDSPERTEVHQAELKGVDGFISGKQGVADNRSSDIEAFEFEKFKALTSESNQTARGVMKSTEQEKISPET